jgi:hypothetical protein
MVILIGNIAAMNVMWLNDLEVFRMSEDQFRNELLYQTTMSLVRSMMNKDMISEEEYHEFNTIMLDKYRPIFGTLFSDISLN